MVSDETLDIPIEAIERNILSETAAEIKVERGSGRESRKKDPEERPSAKRASDKGTASGHVPAKKKQASVPAPPPRKKKPVYREDDWDDEEDMEDEDWDDDDWEEDEGIDAITIMTVVIGCILLIVVAVLGFHMYRQYVPKNYGKAAEKMEEQQEDSKGDGPDEEEGSAEVESTQGVDGRETYTLTIDSNVNVRDQPSTSGTRLMVAQAGETYTCYGSAGDGNWYEIVLEDGSTGYVHGDYVSVE